MTTSSTPISAADREKAAILLAASPMIAFENYGEGWTRFDSRHWPAVKAALDAAPSYEARVVELEAALAAAEARSDETFSELSDEQDAHEHTAKDLQASEARATALLKAAEGIIHLGISAIASIRYTEDRDPVIDAFRKEARAAINAGASNDRR